MVTSSATLSTPLIATFLVTNLLDRHGILRIYKKIVYSKASDGKTWGFFGEREGEYFQIPLWIEIQNTSNSTKVVRNFNAWLYKDKKEVCPFTQINRIQDIVLANNGAYSFVIEPRSINKYDCHFSIKRKDIPGDSIFDEVKLIYFDENDKRIISNFIHIEKDDCWLQKTQKIDRDWALLSK